jgi:hypothetical protein
MLSRSILNSIKLYTSTSLGKISKVSFQKTVQYIQEILFLPLVYEKKLLLSGLMCLSTREKVLMFESSVLGNEFRDYLIILKCKVIHNFLHGKPKTISQVLDQGFSTLYSSLEDLRISKELEIVVKQKYVTFIQHLTTVFFNYKDFTYELRNFYCR